MYVYVLYNVLSCADQHAFILCMCICMVFSRHLLLSLIDVAIFLSLYTGTLHASICGAGIGMFYLVEQRQTLLVYKHMSCCFFPSIYTDEHGQSSSSDDLSRSKPLYFNLESFRKLENIFSGHKIPHEVVRNRIVSDSVIRFNYY